MLEGLAGLAALARDRRAVCLAAAAESLRRRIGVPAPPAWRAELQQHLTSVTAGLEPETVEAAAIHGRSMTLSEVIAFAATLPGPGKHCEVPPTM